MPKRIIEETFRAVKPRGRTGSAAPSVAAIGVSIAKDDLSASLSAAGQQIAQLQSIYQQQALLIAANTQAVLSNTAAKGNSAGGVIGRAASGALGGGLGFLSPIISGIAQLFGGSRSAVAELPLYAPPPAVSITAGLTSAALPGLPSAGSSPQPTIVSGLSRLFNAGSSSTAPVPGETSAQVASSASGPPAGYPDLGALSSNTSSPAEAPVQLSRRPPAGYVAGFPRVATPSSTTPSPAESRSELPFQLSGPRSQPNSVLHTTQITVNVSAMDSQSFMDRSSDIANAVREAMLNTHPINEVIAGL